MKKFLLQYASGYGLKWVASTKARHEDYCAKNGFEYVLATKPQTGLFPHWERYKAMVDIWSKNPDAFIAFLDADCCMVTDEDISTILPDWRNIGLLAENSGWWRSGVILARGCGVLECMFAKMLRDGVVDPKRPFDDEQRLNAIIIEMGYHPYPIPACWNQIVAQSPEHVPVGYPEIKVAAMHGSTDLVKLAFMQAWAKNYKVYNAKASEGGAPNASELCFHMRVSNDLDRAERALSFLRKSYDSDIHLVDDGTGAPELDDLAAKFKATLFRCEKLYSESTQGLMWQWNLDKFLTHSKAKWFIKIDTDSLVLRPFARKFSETKASGVVLRYDRMHPFLQGGCIIIPRVAAQKIFTSNVLNDPKYSGIQWNFNNKSKISEDRVISAAMIESGVGLASNYEANVAVVHPAK